MVVQTPRLVPRPPVFLALLALLAAACGGSDSGTDVPPPTPTIGVATAPATLTLAQGQSGTSTVTLTRGGNFTGAVNLAVSGAPTGVTATLSPTSLTGTTLTSTLTVAAAANAATGPATLAVTATGVGVASSSATVALTVSAAAPTTQTLTVTTAGTGTGTVTSSPAGITCPGTCAAPFAAGSTVTLTATAATGSTFAGWTGACSGTTTTCAVAMSAAQTAGATFNTAAPAGNITLALAPAAVSVQAGATAPAASTVTLTRTNFTGAVALTTSGAPTGLTVTPNPASVAGTSAALDVAAAATVAPGTYNVTVTGAGTGVTSQTVTLAVTVTAAQAAGSFTLAVAPANLPVQQGSSGTTTVTVTRAGSFTGAVALAVSGAPNGVTVTPNPASVTGTTSTLTVAATTAAAAGTYTITVTGTGTGVTQQTATFAVQVTTPPSGGGNVTFSFAGCDATQVPIWLAVQNGSGAWTRVTPGANDAFSFTVGANGGVAYVTQNGTSFSTTVIYGAGTEFGSATNRCSTTAATGGKTLTGAVAGAAATDFVNVSIGGASTFVAAAAGSAFTIRNVADGPRDLIASRAAVNLTSGTQTLNKLIIRRNTNYPSNSAIPTLDFGGSEAFDPVQRTLTVNNLGTDQALVTVSFATANGASGAFFSGVGTGSTIPFFVVPAAQVQATDYHQVSVIASPAGSSPTSFRYVFSFARAPTDRTVTLGPSLGATTVTSLATAPYLRLRAQVPSQSAYNGLAMTTFSQTGRTVSVTSTAAFSGGAPASWTLDIPDLSAAGYDPTWALQRGQPVSWTAIAEGGDFLAFLGGGPADNAQVVAAGASGTTQAFVQFFRSYGINPLRRP